MKKKTKNCIQLKQLISLFVSTSVVGGIVYIGSFFTFNIIKQFEKRDTNYRFRIYKRDIYTEMEQQLRIRESIILTMANLYSVQCPSKKNWPHCFVDLEFQFDFGITLLNMIQINGYAYGPYLNSSQVEDFLRFTHEMYVDTPYLYSSNFGFGVYGLDENANTSDLRYEIKNGSFGKDFMAPILQFAPRLTENPMLYDEYSERVRKETIDELLECTYTQSSNQCAKLSGIITFPTDILDPEFLPSPRCLLFSGIKPLYETGTAQYGYTVIGVFWEDIIGNIIPKRIKGIEVHLYSIKGIKYIFELKNGKVNYIKAQKSNHIGGKRLYNFSNSTNTFYAKVIKSSEFRRNYFTIDIKLFILSYAIIICITSLFFFLYDYVVTKHIKESHKKIEEQDRILDYKKTFVKYIIHEIKNPLNCIFLSIDVLQKEIDDNISLNKSEKSKLDDICFDILLNSNDTLKVVRNLGKFNIQETETISLNKTTFPAWEVYNEAYRGIQYVFLNRGVKLVCSSEENDSNCERLKNIYIEGDKPKLTQVLRNFLSNALKFSKLNNVEFNFNVDTESNEIEFSVKDYGIGIEKDDISKLFREGVQIDPGKNQKGGGEGLGLWISKEIILAHLGKIWVISEGKNMGSTFYCTLPIHTCQNVQKPPQITRISSMVDSSPENNENRMLTTRILYIDDSKANTKIIKRTIERMGFYCSVLNDPTEYATIKDINSYSIILVDKNMPEMDGDELVRLLRKQNVTTKILGLTAVEDYDEIQRFKEAGCDDILQKPLKVELLLSHLDSCERL